MVFFSWFENTGEGARGGGNWDERREARAERLD